MAQRRYVLQVSAAELVAFSQLAAREPIVLVLKSGRCEYQIKLGQGDQKEADSMAKDLVG